MALGIEKRKIEVVIYTQQHKIEGEVWLHKGAGRFTDFMNATTRFGFMPVTNVKVYPVLEDKLLYTVPLLNINKSFIVMAFPKSLKDV